MDVYIIDRELRHDKRYQIMKKWGSNGFSHVFPGVLFTLEEAKDTCTENNYNVVKIGDIWQCA